MRSPGLCFLSKTARRSLSDSAFKFGLLRAEIKLISRPNVLTAHRFFKPEVHPANFTVLT